MSTIDTKIKATADILGGEVFFATDGGYDPEYSKNGDLIPNGMYIRLVGSDGSIAYISAHEIDKALQIIGGVSHEHASKNDIDILTAELNNKVSTSDFELLRGDVSCKASKAELNNALDLFDEKASQEQVDAIITALNEKASQEQVNLLQTAIDAKVNTLEFNTLSDTVSHKANASTVEELQADVSKLKETVCLLNDANSITAINNQIAALTTEINRRLTIDDLNPLNLSISDITLNQNELYTRVANAEVNINKRATTTYVQGQINELNTAITGLYNQIKTKADKLDLSNKADKSSINTLTTTVNNVKTSVETLNIDVDDKYRELKTSINKKAVKSEVDSKIAEIEANVASKVNTSKFNEEINRINNNINNINPGSSEAIQTLNKRVDDISCAVNDNAASTNLTLNSQKRTIDNHTKQITDLQETAQTHTNKLKQNWIRVLTTSEYKALRTAPEGVTYNDRYKYPNVVYFVVDFNTPKAIYIGDIQIAKAEQTGSIGFAYTFPIVF